MFVKTIHILTKVYNELDIITPQVEEAVAESGIQDGMVTVITKHTTTGITVNEALECLESDISIALATFAPEDRPYSHARMLRDYGSTAGNPLSLFLYRERRHPRTARPNAALRRSRPQVGHCHAGQRGEPVLGWQGVPQVWHYPL